MSLTTGDQYERSEQPISPPEMMAELVLLGHVEMAVDDDSQRFEADVRRLNPGWEPGDVPRVPDGYRSGVRHDQVQKLRDEEHRAALVAASLAECAAYWDAQGSLTAEQKRRRLEEEQFRRSLAAMAKTAADAKPGTILDPVASSFGRLSPLGRERAGAGR